jgi:alpha-glucuronidase
VANLIFNVKPKTKGSVKNRPFFFVQINRFDRKKKIRNSCLHPALFLVALLAGTAHSENGSRLWLRYVPLEDTALTMYRGRITQVVIPKTQPFTTVREELISALRTLLAKEISVVSSPSQDGALIAGTPDTCPLISSSVTASELEALGDEGFVLRSTTLNGYSVTLLAGNTPRGILYGAFCLLRFIQTGHSIDIFDLHQKPKIQKRLLNHWDNLDGSVERGYAGRSIWNWNDLPKKIDPRYKDYARANASIGINGTVLNNVNAQAQILTTEYIRKAASAAEALRPWGIQIYFSVKFTAPVEIGGLATSDPLDPGVQLWWIEKAKEIYSHIPDFGGFLVKAYSEGQPGPQIYGRSHADGANMLAKAVAPFGGIVMWRSFVYDLSIDTDRTKCAFLEFVPLDGKFAPNVLVQTKNGPVDFQPREPFNPLFGSMPATPLMLELQITQEYTGQAQHLVYLAPQWKEVLDSDTYAKGPGTTVAKIVDGSAEGYLLSGIAGVCGIGTEKNWTGHHFSQANWYAFGRLAWDYTLSSEQIAEEWIRMTWSGDQKTVNQIKKMMSGSWEACVDYMTPLGLHHLMAEGHHYGPQPNFVHPVREDWSSTYYHKADSGGIGFNRSSAGTNAVGQYFPPLRQLWDDPQTCPEIYLLWFHHLPWDHRLGSGLTIWQALQAHYQRGVDYVQFMQDTWDALDGKIDKQRYEHVCQLLTMQLKNAIQWRDTCLNYFGGFANPIAKKQTDN